MVGAWPRVECAGGTSALTTELLRGPCRRRLNDTRGLRLFRVISTGRLVGIGATNAAPKRRVSDGKMSCVGRFRGSWMSVLRESHQSTCQFTRDPIRSPDGCWARSASLPIRIRVAAPLRHRRCSCARTGHWCVHAALMESGGGSETCISTQARSLLRWRCSPYQICRSSFGACDGLWRYEARLALPSVDVRLPGTNAGTNTPRRTMEIGGPRWRWLVVVPCSVVLGGGPRTLRIK